ncbi:hypothetical protein Bcav_3018 [Beutenbergia cavernae DSM 12333]|uniref:Uncharacterized protein n=1 Tax=Beutenbergia cavernae (strain ATCC BAA-8 / DSM 12333 / CCUG 43141 / JCM 11478 / NBRC 16432 / NCIMB 13614 / HKI 0122) TaxID=471853 RepID=C5BZT3_BEUC1|nr:hypothetical protein [Beutenbergia cavernae]ACQ81263.1 hypothetical protein Bcav_3018 [Beutenbergia cavernae DSM 12333]
MRAPGSGEAIAYVIVGLVVVVGPLVLAAVGFGWYLLWRSSAAVVGVVPARVAGSVPGAPAGHVQVDLVDPRGVPRRVALDARAAGAPQPGAVLPVYVSPRRPAVASLTPPGGGLRALGVVLLAVGALLVAFAVLVVALVVADS